MSDTRTRTWPAVLALAALVAALAATVTGGGTLGDRAGLYGWYAVDGALFALAVVLLRRAPVKGVPALVLAGSVAVAVTGLLAPPRTSDDAYRYLWDGRVQAAGHSPYDHAPDSPALAGLRARAPELFPPGGACAGWDERRTATGDCSKVNRPSVHTIYPPVAEGWFAVLYAAGGRFGVRAAQVGGALLAVAVSGALLLVLRRPGAGPPWRAALWGWCPGVAVWAVNDAHVDTLGVLLMVAGLAGAALRAAGNWGVEEGAASGCVPRRCRGGSPCGASATDEKPARCVPRRRDAAPQLPAALSRPVVGGALLGLSVATKLVPALALPGALSGVFGRRPRARDVLLPLAALAAFALCYLPYLLASGPAVLGYLPGYLHEEGYREGRMDRFGLLRLVLPDQLAAPAGVVVILAAVGWVLFRGDPARPWSGALLVTGTALLVATPAYPWYGLLLVALVALDGRWEWLAVPAAAQVVYLTGGPGQQLAYGAALLAVMAAAPARRRGLRPAAGR